MHAGIMPVTYRVIADKPEELAETLRAKAKQVEGGKWVVEELPEGFALEDIKGLKATIGNLREKFDALSAVAKAFEAAGLTPEAAKDAAAALEQKKAGSLKSSAEVEAWKAEIEKKFKSDEASLRAELEKLTSQRSRDLVTGRLAPIIAAKGGSAAMDAIMALAERRIQVRRDAEGNLFPVVVGSDGKTPELTKKVGSADPMGFDELIDQMREAPGTRGLFEAKVAGGSGSASQSAGSGRAGNQGSAQLSARELIQRANESTMAGRTG